MRAFLFPLLSLLLTGCCFQLPPVRPEPPADEDGGVSGTPLWPDGTVTFGTTDDNGELFQNLGSSFTLYRGPQGGNHAYAKYQVSGGHLASGATFEHRVRRAKDGVLVSKGNRSFDVTATDGGVWTSEGAVIMFLCPTPVGVSIVREQLDFEVIVKGADGKFLGRATARSTLSCDMCEVDCGG
jgi:hypothetical protein